MDLLILPFTFVFCLGVLLIATCYKCVLNSPTVWFGVFYLSAILGGFFLWRYKAYENDIAKSNKIDVEDYEKALERVYQDMMSRHSDPEILRMREDNKKSILGNGYLLRSKDISNLKQVYRNSTSKGDRIGAWDHKPAMKKILPSYYRKDEINSSGRQPVVFGGKIPGDNSYIYDHDFGEIFPMGIL